MKPWTTWLAGLGIAGACFLVTGCGGSDVPDASSDGQPVSGSAAVAAEAAPGGDGGGAPAAPTAVEGPMVAQADARAKSEEPPAETSAADAAPEPETPAAAPKADETKGNSSTAEMLAMAGGPAGGSNPAEGGAAAPADSSTTAQPGSPGGAPGPSGPGAMMRPGGGGGPGAMPGGGMGTPGMGGPPAMGPGAPGQGGPGSEQKARMDRMRAMTPGAGGPQSGADEAMRLGGAGRGGMGQADNGPIDLHNPQGAVKAFLSALKTKDLDRLNESTALRAQTEATAKNQELFRNIFEMSLTDSQLDELATKLEGYTIAGENPQKSTGRVEVILRKTGKNGAYFLRKVTVRREKKGWGVMDIAGAQEFKAINSMPRRKR